MASRLSTRFLFSLNRSGARPAPSTRCLCLQRTYSTEVTPPPLLAKLKGDLKAAMKAKDAARLTVLRSIIAATLNASKTASPIKTDAQLVGLLRRTARASQEAAAEFHTAGREDLAEKEKAQIRVLEEYAQESGIESLSEAQLRSIIEGLKKEIEADKLDSKVATGEALKRLFQPGGVLDGKDVDKAEVNRLVKELLGPGSS